jgi:hypothetical protein
MYRTPLIQRTIYAILVALFFVIGIGQCIVRRDGNLLSDINRLASLGDEAPETLTESIRDRIDIENDPYTINSALLPKLTDPNTSDKQLAIYIWAMGLTKDPNAVTEIIKLSEQTKSELVKGNCLRALATIGGQKSGDYLLSKLDKTADENMRFNILNLLGQMQYEAALPKTEEVLKHDYKQFYYRSIFIFGKMGDKAVPFLLKKIADKDRNIRANAINVLGQWLIPLESAKVFRERFWKETDVELRRLILSSLECVTPDLDVLRNFSKEVVSEEKEEVLVQFAKETLNDLGEMKETDDLYRAKKKISPKRFKKEYDTIFRSAGRKGDYKTLSLSSSFEDEPELKRLRERILQRDSDEAFYDYRKVNAIIMLNRSLNTGN